MLTPDPFNSRSRFITTDDSPLLSRIIEAFFWHHSIEQTANLILPEIGSLTESDIVTLILFKNTQHFEFSIYEWSKQDNYGNCRPEFTLEDLLWWDDYCSDHSYQVIPDFQSWENPSIRLKFDFSRDRNIRSAVFAPLRVNQRYCGLIGIEYFNPIDPPPPMLSARYQQMLDVINHGIANYDELHQMKNNSEFINILINTIPGPLFYKDLKGVFLGCNDEFADRFIGLPQDHIIGRTSEEIASMCGCNPGEFSTAKDMEFYKNPKLVQGEVSLLCRDRSACNFLVYKSGIWDSDNRLIGLVGILVDITPRIKAENRIKTSLNEKEILLREIHHRVKNNMQIISSILYLGAMTIHDTESLKILNESRNRINTMAMIHDKLYQAENIDQIGIKDYITSLVNQIVLTWNNPLIRFSIQVDETILRIDRAISCGLIINELVSNIYKHAFPDQQTGEFSLEFNRFQTDPEPRYRLIVQDNGIGFPAGFNLHQCDKLGIQLVMRLVHQINAQICLTSEAGSRLVIEFS
ncbi:MAG: PAS domain-containing protein [Candidatus Delongbacteria bacterium]|nr:PAS domain-containing protein [Candidatus Delongbacteria bacterium]